MTAIAAGNADPQLRSGNVRTDQAISLPLEKAELRKL